MLKYGIYIVEYWTRLPLNDPMTIAKWIDIEGKPDFESDSFETVLSMLEKEYVDKVYYRPKNNGFHDGTECVLVYVVDSRCNIVATIDFDKTVHLIGG